MKKRDRSINFTREECEKLVIIAYHYKHIIENKKSDGEIWKEKEAAWKAIEAKFNSSSIACRSYKTLKIKFEGLKRLVRHKMDLIWKDQQKTVGSRSVVPLDATEVMIKDMLCLSTKGITNNFDNDASTLENPNEMEPVSMEEEYLEVWVKHEDDLDCSRDSQPTTSTVTEHTVPTTEAPAPEASAPEASTPQDPASDPVKLTGSGVSQPGSGERQAGSGGRQPGSGVRQEAASEASRRLVEERREFLSLHRALMLEEYRNKTKLTEEKGELLDLRRALLVEENDRKRKLWDLEEEYLRLKLKKLNE